MPGSGFDPFADNLRSRVSGPARPPSGSGCTCCCSPPCSAESDVSHDCCKRARSDVDGSPNRHYSSSTGTGSLGRLRRSWDRPSCPVGGQVTDGPAPPARMYSSSAVVGQLQSDRRRTGAGKMLATTTDTLRGPSSAARVQHRGSRRRLLIAGMAGRRALTDALAVAHHCREDHPAEPRSPRPDDPAEATRASRPGRTAPGFVADPKAQATDNPSQGLGGTVLSRPLHPAGEPSERQHSCGGVAKGHGTSTEEKSHSVGCHSSFQSPTRSAISATTFSGRSALPDLHLPACAQRHDHVRRLRHAGWHESSACIPEQRRQLPRRPPSTSESRSRRCRACSTCSRPLSTSRTAARHRPAGDLTRVPSTNL